MCKPAKLVWGELLLSTVSAVPRFFHSLIIQIMTAALVHSTLCLKKTCQVWNGIGRKIIKINLDDIWQKYSKDSRTDSILVFWIFLHCRFAFLSTFCLSNQKPKITRILMLYQANKPNLMRCNFLKHTYSILIILSHTVSKLVHFLRHSEIRNLYIFQFSAGQRNLRHIGVKCRSLPGWAIFGCCKLTPRRKQSLINSRLVDSCSGGHDGNSVTGSPRWRRRLMCSRLR